MKSSEFGAIAFVLLGILPGTLSVGPVMAAERPASGELSRALENLRNSDVEWRREDAAYRRQRVDGSLSANDANEYAEFVASLQRRKLQDCETVRKIGGNDALTGYDCIITSSNGGATSTLPPPPATAKTEAEKLEGLEAELKRLEAELDEELRQKQEAMRERQQNQSVRGGRGGTGDGGSSGTGNVQKPGSSPKWSEPAGDKPAVTGPDSQSTGSQTARNPGETGQQQPGASTPDISGTAGPGAGRSTDKEVNPATAAKGRSENGSDDDIVMRQIREAAERETDPVMKEKLWNEYRKLKEANR